MGRLIGDRLKALRQEPSDLVRELERVGTAVSRQSVHNWITGKTRPSRAHLLALFDVFLIPIEEQAAWQRASAAWTPPNEGTNREGGEQGAA